VDATPDAREEEKNLMDGSTAIMGPALPTLRHGRCFRQHEDVVMVAARSPYQG
jgi:hypothetical protein